MSSDYEKYLKSKEWRVRRELIKSRDHYKCRLCHSTDGIQVHHATYENRGSERDIDLVTLCASCHSVFHGIERKRSREARKPRPGPRPRRRPPPQEAPRQDEIVELMRSVGSQLTAKSLSLALGIKPNALHQTLYRMTRNGLVSRVRRGVYRLPVSGGVP